MRIFSWIRGLRANLLGKEKVERQLDDELRAYVEMVTDERSQPAFLRRKLGDLRWLTLAEWRR